MPSVDDDSFRSSLNDMYREYKKWAMRANLPKTSEVSHTTDTLIKDESTIDVKTLSKEQLDVVAERLYKKLDETNDGIRHLNVLVKHILRTVIEVNEEYKIDHPKFDMLVKMAKEWGVEDGFGDADPDKERD